MVTSTAGIASFGPSDRRLARLAGLVAAGVALGVGELVGGMATPEQSPVASVGRQVIEHAPGVVVRRAIEGLGTSDKAVLLTCIVLVCLGLGAVVGQATWRHRWVGPVAFTGAGLLGMLAGLADPLSNDSVTVVATALSVTAGSATLLLLLRLLPAPVRAEGGPAVAPPAIDRPGTARGSRRSFLTWTGVAGVAGVATALGGRALRGTSRTETARVAVELPPPVSTIPVPSTVEGAAVTGLDVDGLSPLITPNRDFYRIDTALIIPQIDLDGWTLEVRGEVDRVVSFSYDDLLAMPQVAAPVTLACVSNEVGGDLVGTAVWQGVPLTTLLDQAGVRPGGEQVVGRSADQFTVGFPTAVARDGRTALVALGMNGEPLPVNHGFPARLIVEGLYGYVSATKWLTRIELTGWDDFDAYWVPLGWAKEGPIKTQSRIDVPRATKDMAAGQTYPVAGVAWAPGRGISKVEVQVDDGPWREAELGPAASDATWRQWVWPWVATEGRHEVRVRATDGTGALQTADEAPPEPDGATGYHYKVYAVKG